MLILLSTNIMPRITDAVKRVLSKSKITQKTSVSKISQSKIKPVQPVYIQPVKTSIGGSVVDGISSGFGWGIGMNMAHTIFSGSANSHSSNVTHGNSHIDKTESSIVQNPISDSDSYEYERLNDNESYETVSNDSWSDSWNSSDD